MAEQSAVPKEVLDGLAAEAEAMRAQMGNVTPEEPEEPQDPDPDDTPPEPNDDHLEGFLSYEDYVANGGDPDHYMGKKAFAEKRKVIAEKRNFREKFKELDEYVFKQEQRHQKEVERLLKQNEQERAKAKADLDLDAYERLTEERRELEAEKAQSAQSREHPVIAGFREENPQLLPGHAEFDPDYTAAFTAVFNRRVSDAEKAAGRQLTETEVQSHLETTRKKLGASGQAQAARPSKVAPAKRQPVKKDPVAQLDSQTKALYQRWANSNDPAKKKWAEQLLKNQGA